MSKVKEIWQGLYLNGRLFLLMAAISVLFILSVFATFLFIPAQLIFFGILAVLIADAYLLFRTSEVIEAERIIPKSLSLGDYNTIIIRVKNKFTQSYTVDFLDELPFELQERKFKMDFQLDGGDELELNYSVKPLSRGEYAFGDMQFYLTTRLGFFKRKIIIEHPQIVPVMPSVIQMKKYELKAIQKISRYYGMKKIRRLGHSYEFEQIKTYVRGDDIRSINWIATGHRGDLMVNQFQEERAQNVYLAIDKSRNMRMPFDGLSLLDYSINSSLVMANVALKKGDKAGLLSFSDKMDTVIIHKGKE